MRAADSWMECFREILDYAERGAVSEAFIALDNLDPRMAIPLGEQFAEPGAIGLYRRDAQGDLERLLALVRRTTTTATATTRIPPKELHLRVRLARLLRLAAHLTGFAEVSVWPSGFGQRQRQRSTGREGVPEPVMSFGYSIFNAHLELPIGTYAVHYTDLDVFDDHDGDGGSWLPFEVWAAKTGPRQMVITCRQCGLDIVSSGRGQPCAARQQ